MTRPITLFRDRRGTASLEAVMMLPVMAICWAGLFFFLKGFDSQLEAAVEARRKAWDLSNNACRSSKREYDCNGVGGRDDSGGMGWLDGITDIKVGDIEIEFPIIKWLFGSIFGYSTKVDVIRDWSPPAMFGTATKRSRYSYQIMCNEEQMDANDLVVSVICEQVGIAGADFSWMGIECPAPRHSESQCSIP